MYAFERIGSGAWMWTDFRSSWLLLCASLLGGAAHAADGQVVITQAKANAGNITPNDGPGFPISITVPGSYIFGGNIFAAPGQPGIVVSANSVTVDLNGFRLHGASSAGTGIYSTFNNLTVKNGTITGFRFHGIGGLGGDFWMIRDMRIVENGQFGMTAGNFALIDGSDISSNGETGVYCEENCHINHVTVSGNGRSDGALYAGIVVTTGTVLNSTILDNGGVGIGFRTRAAFGNNILFGNNEGGDQVATGAVPLHPNACLPDC